MGYEITRGDYENLGVGRSGATTTFTLESKEQRECFLVLYPKSGEPPIRLPMQPGEERPTRYSVGLKDFSGQDYGYRYENDGCRRLDPYARGITGREHWGDENRREERVYCSLPVKEPFSWRGDRLPRIPRQDMMLYKLHVRGFSMLQNLPEPEKGTLRGVERKLSYLKELGVTTVELMPVYEFEELFAQDPFQRESFPKDKINYWGYTRGNYFALKASYLGEGNTPKAFKELVRKMHRLQMECILEFWFDEQFNPHDILEVLRFWADEYHVDGFHVICSPGVAALVAQDYRLGGLKLFCERWEPIAPENRQMELFSYDDSFLYAVRKMMNRQGGSLEEFSRRVCLQQREQGVVNYLAVNNGFTLKDVFSYGEKHNRDNGEENRDGPAWNFSDNCGAEGASRKAAVNRLRERQIKNALCVLMLARGIPLLWMGDENGNSQNGNNNAYCQDNAVGWKSWNTGRQGRELIAFLKKLAGLRRQLPVLHGAEPVNWKDSTGMGYPDFSCHGTQGWRIEPEGGDPVVGMLSVCREAFVYVGCNFSTVEQSLALPGLPKQYSWQVVLDTGREDSFQREGLPLGSKVFGMKGQSFCLLLGTLEEATWKV